MDWSRGYSSKYYATIVDRATWMDTTRVNITGGSIQKSDDDLLESADIDCVDYEYSQNGEQWIRVWLDTRQEGGSYSHTPLFTGVAISPIREIDGTLETNSIQCYSVLKPAQDVLLPRGWYAPIDIDIAILIKRLLAVTSAPVAAPEGEKKLEQSIIAEEGETNLTMAWRLALAAGWIIQITGSGEIIVGPQDDSTKMFIGTTSNDIIETSVSITYDWYQCPNVFRATSNGISAIARDDNPDSILSTIARGREIWAEENDCDLASGQSISDYAKKRLEELQSSVMTISYNRRFNPNVGVGDIIYLDYPVQGIVGLFRVTSQNITLGYSARVAEEAVRVWD